MEIPKVVEEGLRYDPPVQAWRRQAKEDVTLEGVHIPAGSHILLVLAAANRDPERFVKPDEFDPSRPDATQPLTFGIGAHFCLGAPLARLEIATMIERLKLWSVGVRLKMAMDGSRSIGSERTVKRTGGATRGTESPLPAPQFTTCGCGSPWIPA